MRLKPALRTALKATAVGLMLTGGVFTIIYLVGLYALSLPISTLGSFDVPSLPRLLWPTPVLSWARHSVPGPIFAASAAVSWLGFDLRRQRRRRKPSGHRRPEGAARLAAIGRTGVS